VPALEQVAPIEIDRLLQPADGAGIERRAGQVARGRKGALEHVDVEPERCPRAEGQMIGVNFKQRLRERSGASVQCGLQLPEGLTQILTRLSGRAVAPEDGRQRLAGLL